MLIRLLADRRQRSHLESRQRQCKEDVEAVVDIFALLKIGNPFCVGF